MLVSSSFLQVKTISTLWIAIVLLLKVTENYAITSQFLEYGKLNTIPVTYMTVIKQISKQTIIQGNKSNYNDDLNFYRERQNKLCKYFWKETF